MDFRCDVRYPVFGRWVLTGFLDKCVTLPSLYTLQFIYNGLLIKSLNKLQPYAMNKTQIVLFLIQIVY